MKSTVLTFLAALAFILPALSVHAQQSTTVTNTPSGQETTVTNSPVQSGQTAADACGHGAGQTIVNPLKVCSITDLLNLILDAVIQLGTVILTLALIWTGFKFVAARGNPEAISSARTALIWTVIGGLILLGAKAIEVVIQSTVNTL